MKTVRNIFLLLTVGIILIGVSSCMGQKNHEFEISTIKQTVEQRYGEKFSVEYFLPAKDETYDNILTLSDSEGIVFNAYQSKDNGEMTDDYPEALINAKLTSHMKTSLSISSDLKISTLGVLENGSVLTVDFAKNYTVSPSNQDFVKLITVISLTDSIVKQKEELFDIYTEILKFNSSLIELEVVSFLEVGEELSRALHNPLGYYTNNWEEFQEITNYIHITSKNISSADELVKEVK